MNLRETALNFLKDESTLSDKEIINLLRAADDVYSNDGESFISDSEYDQIRLIAERIDPTNEYFLGVGSEIRKDKVKLPYPMGSLNQVQVGEIEDWVTDKGLSNEEFVVTDKMDGISVLLVYDDNGDFQIALTRGDGFEGQDITRHVKHIPSVPKKVSGKMSIRAEIEYSESNFLKAKQLATRKDGSQYKNSRNAVAGMMNQEKVVIGALELLTVFAYEIMGSKSDKSVQLGMLELEKFTTVDYKFYHGRNLTDEVLSKLIQERKSKLDFAIDGIVLDINNTNSRNRLSKSQKSDTLNPAYSIKYKVQDIDNVAIATVKSVEWNLSKHGYAKPKVKLEPFDLQGVTIQNATGFNAKFINDNKIGPGAVVKMTRSGDVIPYIISVEKQADKPQMPDDIDDYVWSDNYVDLILKDFSENTSVKLKQLVSWATSLDIPMLKEGNIKDLFDKGYDTPAKIVNITQPTMIAIVGKNGNKIIKGLHEKLNNCEIHKLVGSWPLFGSGLGVRKFKKLQQHLESIDKPNALIDGSITYADIEGCEGFETKMINKVLDGIPGFLLFLKDIQGKYSVCSNNKTASGKFNGQRIIFTGFRDSDLQAIVENEGGEIASSVSNKTTLVVALDPDALSGKTNKARDLGIKIISKQDFEEMIGGKDSALEEMDKKDNQLGEFFEF